MNCSDLVFNFLNFISKVLKDLVVLLVVLNMESCNDVVNILWFSESIFLQVPVVDDEGKVILNLHLLSHFVSCTESLSHDGNKHV